MSPVPGHWPGCNRNTEGHVTDEPIRLSLDLLLASHLRPRQASLATGPVLSLLAFPFKLISHFPSRRSPKTHPKTAFGKKWSFLLPVSSLALKTCIQDSWKHDLIFCHYLCLAFHGKRMCLFQKSLKNLQNVIFLEALALRAFWALLFSLVPWDPFPQYLVCPQNAICCSDRKCTVQTEFVWSRPFTVSYFIPAN